MTVVETAARRVLVASLLYYRHDLSVVNDAEFDDECAFLARRWSALPALLQWQLGSAEAVAASGFRCRVTMATEGGARAWASRVLGTRPPFVPIGEWRWSELRQVRWVYAGG